MTQGSGPVEPEGDFDTLRRFVRAPGVLWRQVTDAVLVRTVVDATVVELSGAAALVWVALDEPTAADDLVGELATLVGAPLNVVANDVNAALDELVQRGLVSTVGTS